MVVARAVWPGEGGAHFFDWTVLTMKYLSFTSWCTRNCRGGRGGHSVTLLSSISKPPEPIAHRRWRRG